MKRLVTSAIVIAMLAVTWVFATYSWHDNLDLTEADVYAASWTEATVPVSNNYTEITRSALDTATNTVDVTVTITSDRADAIEEIWLETCEDANSNTIIEESEWSPAAEGTVLSPDANGGTTASVASTTLDTTHDGYRVRTVWDNDERLVDMVLRPGVTSNWGK